MMQSRTRLRLARKQEHCSKQKPVMLACNNSRKEFFEQAGQALDMRRNDAHASKPLEPAMNIGCNTPRYSLLTCNRAHSHAACESQAALKPGWGLSEALQEEMMQHWGVLLADLQIRGILHQNQNFVQVYQWHQQQLPLAPWWLTLRKQSGSSSTLAAIQDWLCRICKTLHTYKAGIANASAGHE